MKLIKRMIRILVLIFFVGLLFILLFKAFEEPYTTPDKIKKEFAKNYQSISSLTDYLVTAPYSSITIQGSDYKHNVGMYGYWYVHNGEETLGENEGKVPINDDEIVQEVTVLLRQRKYQVIGKCDNTIYFQLWSDLDAGRGIAFSIDGTQPQLQFLTKLEAISDDSWYYYEEDYNVWKNNSTTNGIPKHLLGEWSLKYAKTRDTEQTEKDYSLQDLYGTGIKYGGKLTFYSDGTFSRYVGITTEETEDHEGTYILRYDNKILLQYKNGTTSTVEYLPQSQEMVYYTWDTNQQPINEYYSKQK